MDNRMKYCEVQVAKEPTGKLPGALFFNMPGKTKKYGSALAGVAQLVGVWSCNRKVADLIPSKGT